MRFVMIPGGLHGAWCSECLILGLDYLGYDDSCRLRSRRTEESSNVG
jgi:hypothetical protein